MQKVSKQSLAMIALSILLAISIALTFTFAAIAGKTDKATGTITFSGDVAIQMAGFEGTTGAYTFTLTENADGVALADSYKIGLAAKSVSAFVKIEVAAPTGENVNAVTIANAATVNAAYTAEGNTFTSKAKINAGETVQLNQLIKISANLNALTNDTDVTFVVTVKADVVVANL